MSADFVDVPDGYLYYEQRGTGPDVVFINAGLADLRMWDSTVSWLADVARVTRWDTRDTGLSSEATGPFSEIDDLTAVLDAAAVSRAILVGCSNGGRQALAYAHRHPDRVAHVCVVGGSFGEFPDPSPEELLAREEMKRTFTQIEHVLATEGIRAAITLDVDSWCPALDEPLRRQLIGWEVANSHVLTMEVAHGVELDPPIQTRFAELTTPVSVLVGGRDFQGTQLWAKRLADQAPNATLQVLPEADHFAMLSAPEEFKQFLTRALETSR